MSVCWASDIWEGDQPVGLTQNTENWSIGASLLGKMAAFNKSVFQINPRYTLHLRYTKPLCLLHGLTTGSLDCFGGNSVLWSWLSEVCCRELLRKTTILFSPDETSKICVNCWAVEMLFGGFLYFWAEQCEQFSPAFVPHVASALWWRESNKRGLKLAFPFSQFL